MKQPTLVLALAASAWLLLQPFLHWMVHWRIDRYRFIVDITVCVIFAMLVAHAVNRRHARWGVTFAALVVALNPLWPLQAPARGMMAITIAAGVASALYAVRRWK
ncbi:MAG: hypothetical protein KF724_02290 [Phycisphaeraceae bacterium]|nr:hypothetical protein [Phycisphaeraceae bacterium]